MIFAPLICAIIDTVFKVLLQSGVCEEFRQHEGMAIYFLHALLLTLLTLLTSSVYFLQPSL